RPEDMRGIDGHRKERGWARHEDGRLTGAPNARCSPAIVSAPSAVVRIGRQVGVAGSLLWCGTGNTAITLRALRRRGRGGGARIAAVYVRPVPVEAIQRSREAACHQHEGWRDETPPRARPHLTRMNRVLASVQLSPCEMTECCGFFYSPPRAPH